MKKTLTKLFAIIGAVVAAAAVIYLFRDKIAKLLEDAKCCCKQGDDACKADGLEGAVEDAVETVEEKAEDFAEAVADAAEDAKEKAAAIAEEFKDYADAAAPEA